MNVSDNAVLFAADIGNTNTRIIKGFRDTDAFLDETNLMRVSAARFKQEVDENRGRIPDGWAEVTNYSDGAAGQTNYYVYGRKVDQLADYQVVRPLNEARWTPDYFGVILAIGIANLTRETEVKSAVYMSYPPSLAAYRKNQFKAGGSKWLVRIGTREVYIEHVWFNSQYEPTAACKNLILSQDGDEYQRQALRDDYTLVFDMGGGTTDIAGVEPNARTSTALRDSINVGVRTVTDKLTQATISAYPMEFTGIQTLSSAQVTDALLNGYITHQGTNYPVGHVFSSVMEPILTSIQGMLSRYQRPISACRNLVLAGGGTVVFRDQALSLFPNFNRDRIFYAMRDPKRIHLATVHGLYKEAILLRGQNDQFAF